jgi:hypothetical protein
MYQPGTIADSDLCYFYVDLQDSRPHLLRQVRSKSNYDSAYVVVRCRNAQDPGVESRGVVFFVFVALNQY